MAETTTAHKPKPYGESSSDDLTPETQLVQLFGRRSDPISASDIQDPGFWPLWPFWPCVPGCKLFDDEHVKVACKWDMLEKLSPNPALLTCSQQHGSSELGHFYCCTQTSWEWNHRAALLATWMRCLGRSVRLDDLQKSLPILAILWFCELCENVYRNRNKACLCRRPFPSLDFPRQVLAIQEHIATQVAEMKNNELYP